MNFQVPQYIEVEDKIFGPLTFRQFAYLAGGAGVSFIIFAYIRNLSTVLAIILMIPVIAFFAALAFVKINGRPMIVALEAASRYFTASRLYLWKRSAVKPKAPIVLAKPEIAKELPKLSESKLRDLSWSLDINENLKS